MKKSIVMACLLAAMQTGAWAKVVLPDILSDNMVLQQQTEVKLWGKANPNAQVNIRVSWSGQTYTIQSDASGKWLAKIQTPAATYEAQSITFSDGEETKLSNILIGEVWFVPASQIWKCR